MTTIYHFLDEAEVFSEWDGGAISRWAANVLRDGEEIIICPSFDASWAFPRERTFALPHWHWTNPIHPVLYRLPWVAQRTIYLSVFRGLLKRLRKGDVIYVHNRPESAAVLATIARAHGIIVALHMHNSHLVRSNTGQLKALRRIPIIFCSEFLRREAHTLLPNQLDRTYVVYNGADDKKFRAAERKAILIPTVIFTGRLVHYKGVHILLEAMRILERKGTRVRCKIVGAAGFGRYKSTRYTRALDRLRPDNTELVGYRSGDTLADMLRNASIFCCPSIWNDPFPLAPLEAMATGLPVVASDVGGIPEALAHGGGVLVPPNNPMLLAEALEILVKDPKHRVCLGKKARACFEERFVWSSVREQYDRVIQDILA